MNNDYTRPLGVPRPDGNKGLTPVPDQIRRLELPVTHTTPISSLIKITTTLNYGSSNPFVHCSNEIFKSQVLPQREYSYTTKTLKEGKCKNDISTPRKNTVNQYTSGTIGSFSIISETS